jgi:hypothetical protein
MKKIVLIFFMLCFLPVIGYAQSDCPSGQILRFSDGATGCMSDYKYFTYAGRNNSDGLRRGSTAAKFIVAQVKNPAICPINLLFGLPGGANTPDSMALNRCEDRAAEVAQKENKNPAGCECEIIYHSGYSSNIPFPKTVFEAKARSHLAYIQNYPEFSDQFTEEEKKSNAQFFADYIKQGSSTNAKLASSAADKKLQDELAKKQQLDKEQKELAERARIEKEKSLTEERRIAQEIAQKGQLDKDATNKARIEKEKSLAEEKRIAQEMAKVQALEKEKADLIAKLQQEKDAREKAASTKVVSDEARILALRKELEKEIRASIQTESTGKNVNSPATVFANRKALVIGNDSYQKVAPLSNAREDAKVLAESLGALGYKVSLKLDVTEKQFKSEIRTFKGQIQPGDEVAIFYAGHGVQINSTNFLLPIDIGGQSEEEVKDEAVSLQRLLDDMNDKGAKFTLAMIDACRDNPFKGNGRSIAGGRGLAPTTAATGQMIVFSAGSGQQALDKLGAGDKSKNGLFTRVFVKEMQKPGVTVDRVVRNVRSEVVSLAKSVGHDQVPAIYDQVVGEFYFKR